MDSLTGRPFRRTLIKVGRAVGGPPDLCIRSSVGRVLGRDLVSSSLPTYTFLIFKL